ncbi:MAG TPA: murein biosynthesis integral membrane protein MurJ [Thermoanaerobaculia bacterium]|nr:murein biosynthesis integral membrane protein MurJ [Thermoanaerobaculia bacterium]
MSDVNSEPVAPPPQPAKRSGGYALLVAAGILLSRFAGLIRNSVFAHYLGASAPADAFNVALRVPNFLQNLLGEGVLSASFIPVYSRLLARGEQREADRVAGVFVSFLAIVVVVIVAVGMLFTPVVVRIIAGGLEPEIMAMAVRYTRILFPGIGVLVLYAWALGILNAHRQFFISYVAPVLWSAAMIATLLICGMRMRGEPLAHALAWGTLAGCFLQFAIEVPFVLKHAKHMSFGLDRANEAVRSIFRNLWPVVAGRGVVQISGYVDTFVASLLPTGGVSLMTYAQAIYFMPISVFGMSVAAAELPQMSSVHGSEEEIRVTLRTRLDRGLRQVAFFIVPTVVAFLTVGRAILAALFQRGAFTPMTTMLVWYALVGASIGLTASTMSRLYSSTFYALHDSKTPYRVAMMRVVLSASLSFLFAIPLRPMFIAAVAAAGLPLPSDRALVGVMGITTASGVAAWLEYLLLRHRLDRRLGKGAPRAGYMTKLWIAAIAGGAAGVLVQRFVSLPKILQALVACGAFGVVYFIVAAVLGVHEVRSTLSRFRRR